MRASSRWTSSCRISAHDRAQLGGELRLPGGAHPPAADARGAARARRRRGRACGCSARAIRSTRSRDADELVSLRALPADVTTDGETVSFGAGLTYGELAVELGRHGLALHNLASLPHISVAGAIATGTHGSGNAQRQPRHGGARARAASRRPATSCGCAAATTDFDGAVVALGALGVVTRLTLAVEPAVRAAPARLRGPVVGGAGRALRRDHRRPATASASSPAGARSTQSGSRAAGRAPRRALRRAPGDGRAPPDHRLDPVNCTRAARRPRTVVGPAAALPHGLHAVQRRGDPERVPAAAPARGRRDRGRCAGSATGIRPLLQVTRDPHGRGRPAVDEPDVRARHGRAALHLGARPGGSRSRAGAARGRARAVRPRPHWGKVFLGAPDYPRGADFLALAERYDPRGAFRNGWLSAAPGPRCAR